MTNNHPQLSVGSVYRQELANIEWAASMDFERLIATDQVITERLDGNTFLADALWDICFPRYLGGVLAHHTDLTAFGKIIASREIWLHAVSKQTRWGELELFAQQFGLKGYLEKNAQGNRVLDDLAKDLFSLSLTSGVPSWELWGKRFGPVRMNLEVLPTLQRSELRCVTYAAEDLLHDHPLKILCEVGMRRFGKPLVPPKINRAGAFFLPLKYQKQQEVRLLVKRLPGSPAVDTKFVNNQEVIPVSLEKQHPRVGIRLVGVQLIRPELVGPVEEILRGVAHWDVPVEVLSS